MVSFMNTMSYLPFESLSKSEIYPELIIANFEKSANLSEFLSKYGLVESTGLSENYKEQLKKYNAYKEEFKK